MTEIPAINPMYRKTPTGRYPVYDGIIASITDEHVKKLANILVKHVGRENRISRGDLGRVNRMLKKIGFELKSSDSISAEILLKRGSDDYTAIVIRIIDEDIESARFTLPEFEEFIDALYELYYKACTFDKAAL